MKDNIFLSPHFKLREFTESTTARKHNIVNEPPPEAVENLRRLCEGCLEPLREQLGLPVIITSAYRAKALNNIIAHSSQNSQHMQGQAADFYVSGPAESADSAERTPSTGSGTGSHRERLIMAFRLILTSESIDFDQLILYPNFIHVSYVSREANRHSILLGCSDGKLGYGRISLQNALTIE